MLIKLVLVSDSKNKIRYNDFYDKSIRIELNHEKINLL